MKEQVLLDFLQNKVSVEILANDLNGSQERTSFDTTTMHIEVLKSEDSFEIRKIHCFVYVMKNWREDFQLKI